MAICVVCGTDLRGKRSDAKYCSEKCKKAAQRNVTGANGTLTGTLTGQSVPVSGTLTGQTGQDVPVTVSGTIIKTVDQIPDAIKSRPLRNKSKDIWDSPGYDLSEPGFKRRNKNWDDDNVYPGTESSRSACMAAVSRSHRELMLERSKVRRDLDRHRAA
ncbi:MAG: hypothetical protein Q7J27_02575 [Syntrophales bacterium]|nr:hypothetical protein [Syntrophales bacterium]